MKSSVSRVFRTSPHCTQPRRAIPTPNLRFFMLLIECASVEITNLRWRLRAPSRSKHQTRHHLRRALKERTQNQKENYSPAAEAREFEPADCFIELELVATAFWRIDYRIQGLGLL